MILLPFEPIRCEHHLIQKKHKLKLTSWTHLKNMQQSTWESFPQVGVNIFQTFELPPNLPFRIPCQVTVNHLEDAPKNCLSASGVIVLMVDG